MPPHNPRKSRRTNSGKQPPVAVPPLLDANAVQHKTASTASAAHSSDLPSPPLPAFSRPRGASSAAASTGAGSDAADSGASPPPPPPPAQAASNSSGSSNLLPPVPPQQLHQQQQQGAAAANPSLLKTPCVAAQQPTPNLMGGSYSSSTTRSLLHSHHRSAAATGNFPSQPAAAAAAAASPPPPPYVRRRIGGTTNVGATVLDSIVTLPTTLFHLWSFLSLGVLTCIDKLLDLYLLPVRMALLFQKRLTLRHIVLGVFAAFGALSLALHPFGEGPGHAFSYWYHLVQGISALKLYVMCSMLEVGERLVANMGGDVLEALWVEVGMGGDLVAMSIPVAPAASPPPPTPSFSSAGSVGGISLQGAAASAAGGAASPQTPASPPPAAAKGTMAAAAADDQQHFPFPTHVCSVVESHNRNTGGASSSSSSGAGGGGAAGTSTTTTSSSSSSSSRSPSSFVRNISLVLAGLILTSVHSYVIVLQVVVYNVALNGDSYSLIALLASNNFSELRRMVNRKVASDDLFRTACGDVIEQMQLVVFFVVMLLRHSMSVGFGTVEVKDLVLILVVEICIDSLKHTFVIRNNGITEKIYSRFEAVWFWDVARDVFRSRYLADCKKALCDPVTALGLSLPEGAVVVASGGSAAPAAPASSYSSSAAASLGGGGVGRVSSEPSVQPPPASANRSNSSSRTAGRHATSAAPPPLTTTSTEDFNNVQQQQNLQSSSSAATPIMTPLALPPQRDTERSPVATEKQQHQQSSQNRSRSSEKKSPSLSASAPPVAAAVSSSVGASTLPSKVTRVPALLIPKGTTPQQTPNSNASQQRQKQHHHHHHHQQQQQQQQQQASVSSSVLSPAQQFFRFTVFSTVIDESLLFGYPSRRVGLVTAPYVAVLWWISFPLLWSASSYRVLVWVLGAVMACRLLIRAINRGYAARWVCRARSWGPGRPPPSAISTAGSKTGAVTVDELTKHEQDLLARLDKVQQFRFA